MELSPEEDKRRKNTFNLFLFIIALSIGVILFIKFFFVFPFPSLFILISLISIYSIIILELMDFIPKKKTILQWIIYDCIIALPISLWTYVGFVSFFHHAENIPADLEATYLITVFILSYILELLLIVFATYELAWVELKTSKSPP
jgi:hypothetical protein